jgi:hypothetical protein
MFGHPSTWLIGGAVLCVALFFGAVQVRHQAKLEAARAEGVAIGKGAAATETLVAAKEAAADYQAAEAETPLDADREYFKRLCAKSASCALRSKYQAVYRGKK